MSTPQLVTYRPEYARAYADLNYEWIEKFFAIEDEDRKALEDPEGYAINPGGQIFFTLVEGEPVGTVAMVPVREKRGGKEVLIFELAKMAVSPAMQGRGLSDLLMQACIDFAREQGAVEVMLVTNDVLTPALGLYKKHGFEIETYADQRYDRGNTQMTLVLSPEDARE